MTVKQLIEKLKEFPDDFPITILNDINWSTKDDPENLTIKQCTWIHSNYPYDKLDFEYLNIE